MSWFMAIVWAFIIASVLSAALSYKYTGRTRQIAIRVSVMFSALAIGVLFGHIFS